MVDCLSRMMQHIETSHNRQGGKLRALIGVRVVVGKYMGLNDEGACIVPWDWDMQ
jgi:hypothetical protein